MTLINEKWYIYENGALRLATQEEIDKHFAGRKSDNSYWTGDFS